MKVLGWLVCISGLLLADGGKGVRPRPSAADYPAREAARTATVAAAMIAPGQVRKAFATDLNSGGYLVVEVAVYPQAGSELNLVRSDFLLRAGADGETVRPETGRTIAGVLARKYSPPRPTANDVSVYSSTSVGYETGTDPVTGRRVSGVYTGAGVGVGVGDPGPPSPPPGVNQDPSRIEQELEDQSLPEGKTSQAVAGYLYFPKPSGKANNATYELTYYGADGQIRLRLPLAKAKAKR
jgi:hypothetical protein